MSGLGAALERGDFGSASSSSQGLENGSGAQPLHSALSMEDDFEDEYDSDQDISETTHRNSINALSSTNVPSITAAIFASGTTGGTTYAFGLYANALKHTLHLSQSELDTISSAFFCAGLLSWAPGLVVDRQGPKFGIILGGLLGALSLVSYWMVATSTVSVPRPLIVSSLSALGISTYVSSALVTGAVFKIIVSCTGPGTKGTAVGAAKGYVGLGSGAYACMFSSIRKPGGGVASDLNFLLFPAAFFATFAASVPALCLLPPKKLMTSVGKRDVTTGLHFKVVYAGLLGLGVIVVGTSILSLYEESASKHHNHGDGHGEAVWEEDGRHNILRYMQEGGGAKTDALGQSYPLAALIILMWFGPILLMLCLPQKNIDTNRDTSTSDVEEDSTSRSRQNGKKKEKYALLEKKGDDDEEEGHEPATTDGAKIDTSIEADDESKGESFDRSDAEGEEELLNTNRRERHQSSQTSNKPPVEDLTLTQMLRTGSSWLLLWTCTILAGGGTVITNNVGQMVEALRLDPSTSSASLALFSAAQAASRVLTGSLSEAALQWSCRLPRPAFLVVASFGGCAAHLLLATATTEVAFVVGVALSGAAFGMIWPLMVLIVGECFGTAHVGANYM